MRYMILIYGDPVTEAPPERPADAFAEWADATRALQEAGALVAGEGLAPAGTATTLRFRGGETLMTDGPFMETKEHLLGFYMIEVPTLDDALAWGARMPNMHWGSVEVRPVLDGDGSARHVR